MKKTILYLLAAFTLVFTSVSCESADALSAEAQSFMDYTVQGAYKMSTGSKYVYDKTTQQTSIRTGASFGFQFKLQNDEQASYFVVKTSKTPSTVGETLSATVTTKSIVFLDSQTLSLEVIKISGSKAWLWSSDKQTGLLINIE